MDGAGGLAFVADLDGVRRCDGGTSLLLLILLGLGAGETCELEVDLAKRLEAAKSNDVLLLLC